MNVKNDWPDVAPATPEMESGNNITAAKNRDERERTEGGFSQTGIETLPALRDDRGRFSIGGKGGPGRKFGSRNKFSEVFFRAIVDDFQAHGHDALAKLREVNVEAYLRVIAALLPKGAAAKFEQGFVDVDLSTLSDEELVQLIESVRRRKFVQSILEHETGA